MKKNHIQDRSWKWPLCRWSPHHRCYQSLWTRSQSEPTDRVFVKERFWSPIVSAAWQKNKLHCWRRHIEWLWFLFWEWSGTFPLSSIHFPRSSALEAFGERHCVWADELRSLFSLRQNNREPPRTQNTEQHLVSVGKKKRKKKCSRSSTHPQHTESRFTRRTRSVLHKVWSVMK